MKIASIIFLLLFVVSTTFADVKITQKVTIEGQGTQQTRMIKGSRERTESKIVMTGENAAATEFMPTVATITQCDLRRTLSVNDKKKLYFIEPFNDESPSPSTPNKTVTKTRQGGIVTITFNVTDTLERKQMFGLTARHLKVLQMIESSADSCGGAAKTKMEIDGWYADFSAEFNCPIDVPDVPRSTSKPDCRDRIVYKRSGTTKLGFLLDGTMKTFDAKGNVAMTSRTETLEISRAPLSLSFFEEGKDYRLANEMQELYAMPSMTEMMAMGNNSRSTGSNSPTATVTGKKTVGIKPLSGDISKLNQDLIVASISESMNSKGFAAFPSSSGQDYFVGVEIKKVKQSGAAKIGGLFGKVTGNSDAAKIGDSEVEVIVTLYQQDGVTVIAQQTSKQKVSGSPDDAAKAAIENAFNGLAMKIK